MQPWRDADAPPVGNQHPLGSCVGWATAYAAKGILATEKYRRETKLSPSFVYNQLIQRDKELNKDIPKDTCVGTSVIVAPTLLRSQGACRWEEMPYGPSGCVRQPTDATHWSALSHRIEWGRLKSETDVAAYKAHLAKGHPRIISVECTTEYTKHAGGNGYWTIHGSSHGDTIRHAMRVVGYDDNREYDGKRQVRPSMPAL